MCGRYESINQNIALDLLNGDVDQVSEMKFGEVFPTNNGIVETADGYKVMKWGFKFDFSPRPVINARQETVLEKPMFKKDIITHRCIILASKLK